MGFNVDDETVRTAANCEKEHACLGANESQLCPVQSLVTGEDDALVFVECLKMEACAYRLSFGESYVCRCPVRVEIYRKFGK